MTKSKTTIIISFVLIIAGAFIGLDLVRYFNVTNIEDIYSMTLKAAIVLLTSLLAFNIGGHGLSRKDERLLRLIYLLIILADLSLLIFDKAYLGIAIFFLVQSCLIYRNVSYISNRYSFVETSDRFVIIFASLLIVMLLIYINMIRSRLDDLLLLILFIVYGAIKSLSLLTSILAFKLKVFPKTNRTLLLIGVVCFYICDLNVGLAMAFRGDSLGNLSNVLTWIFYTPALTLIALSGYDFNNP